MIDPIDLPDPDDHQWDQAERSAFEAYELYEKGQMSQALEKLTEAIEMNPTQPSWYFNTALTLDALERYEEAIGYFQRAIDLGGQDEEILNSLAVDYTRIGQYEKSLSLFEEIEKITPGYEACYCNRIITYTEMEQHEKAEQMFYLAQQINPDCAICFYNIGNSLFTRGEYERAIWCWKKAAELEPMHPQIHYRIAQAAWAAGKTTQAREEFLAEVRNDPTCLELLLDFGIFLLEQGEIDSAREKFNRILEYDDQYAPAWFYLGELENLTDRCESAVHAYEKAMSLERRCPGPRFRLAQIAIKNEHHEKAIRYLHQEMAMNLDDADVLLSMAWMLARLEQMDSASQCFLRVLDLDQKESMGYYGLGLCLALCGNYEGAEQCFRHAITLDPDHPDYHLAHSWLALRQQKWREAIERSEVIRYRFTEDPRIVKACQEIRSIVRIDKMKQVFFQFPPIAFCLEKWLFLRRFLRID